MVSRGIAFGVWDILMTSLKPRQGKTARNIKRGSDTFKKELRGLRKRTWA